MKRLKELFCCWRSLGVRTVLLSAPSRTQQMTHGDGPARPSLAGKRRLSAIPAGAGPFPLRHGHAPPPQGGAAARLAAAPPRWGRRRLAGLRRPLWWMGSAHAKTKYAINLTLLGTILIMWSFASDRYGIAALKAVLLSAQFLTAELRPAISSIAVC